MEIYYIPTIEQAIELKDKQIEEDFFVFEKHWNDFFYLHRLELGFLPLPESFNNDSYKLNYKGVFVSARGLILGKPVFFIDDLKK